MIDLAMFEDGVARITLDNAPANTFDAKTLLELKDHLLELDREGRVRAIVITGRGEKFFSAGAELREFSTGDKEHARTMAIRFGAAFEALQEVRAVTIAAINGFAMGGGLECALCCDIRIAEEHAIMGLPEASVGLLPGGCGTQTLPWLIGEGWAKRIILTNERVDAALALRIGLVEEVVARGQGLSKAVEIAQRVKTLSPHAVASSKELIHLARRAVPRTAALAVEREKFMDLFDGENSREGVSAFLNKRKPVWKVG